MPVLVSIEVVPIHAQVCLLDAAWQDYPQWETGQEAVAYRAPSLTDPERPPFPGFAVATRPDCIAGDVRPVRVDVLWQQRPSDRHLAHVSVLSVGRAGAIVGNIESGLTPVNLPAGEWPVEVWVDRVEPESVSHVLFALCPA